MKTRNCAKNFICLLILASTFAACKAKKEIAKTETQTSETYNNTVSRQTDTFFIENSETLSLITTEEVTESVKISIDTANGTATTTRRKLTTRILQNKTANEFQGSKGETLGKKISEQSAENYQSETKEETHEGNRRSLGGTIKLSLIFLLLLLIILFSLRKIRRG